MFKLRALSDMKSGVVSLSEVSWAKFNNAPPPHVSRRFFCDCKHQTIRQYNERPQTTTDALQQLERINLKFNGNEHW